MSKLPNMKHYALIADFAADLGISKEAVAKMKASGTIPADAFTMNGRDLYVKKSAAMAALKVATIGARGKVPVWVHKVGNKAGIAKAKAIAAKAEAKQAKKAA